MLLMTSWLSPLILATCVAAVLPALMFADAVKKEDNSNLQASAAASLNWLSYLDKGDYAQSWENASSVMKSTINKDEWEVVMKKTRQPLGSVTSRQVLDQRTAQNPHGLPAGDYMVMFYKTKFSSKEGNELVTLFSENGQWKVLTYQVD